MAVLGAVLAGLGSCAKVGPPPGGPEDRDPPQITEVVPPNGAAGVAPDSAVTIIFSERPDRRSVMRSLLIFPAVDFAESAWEENRLRLRPETGWTVGRNTLIRVGREAKDRRGNRISKPFGTRFTTKALPDTGVAFGRVWMGREAERRKHPTVLAFAVRGDSLGDPDVDAPDAAADASEKGKYRLEGLDTAETYRIVGILDADDDLRATSGGEARGEPPAPIAFGESAREVEVPDFLIGTLDSLGVVGGTVAGDSGRVAFVRLERIDGQEPDRPRIVRVPDDGNFSVEVETGASYRVSAFVDVDGDSLPGPDETLVERDEPVSLEFVPEQTGVRFDLTTGDGEEPVPTDPVPKPTPEDPAPPADPERAAEEPGPPRGGER